MTRRSSQRDQAAARIFGTAFILERRLTRLADRELADDDITTKQWLVLATVAKLFAEPPRISDVATALNTAHQNVKAIAVKLVDKALLRMDPDVGDRRATRLVLTDANERFWAARDERDLVFLRRLVEVFDDTDLAALDDLLGRLAEAAAGLELEIGGNP